MTAYRVTITAIVVEDGDGDPGNWDVDYLLKMIKKNRASHDPEVETVALLPEREAQCVQCSSCQAVRVIS